MLEPAPPGELCSGKLGEFSQALRADSIFRGREGKAADDYRAWWGPRAPPPPLHPVQGPVTFSVRSAVGKDIGDRPMALWI